MHGFNYFREKQDKPRAPPLMTLEESFRDYCLKQNNVYIFYAYQHFFILLILPTSILARYLPSTIHPRQQ